MPRPWLVGLALVLMGCAPQPSVSEQWQDVKVFAYWLETQEDAMTGNITQEHLAR